MVNKLPGFSLIELLVTVTIIITTTGLSLVGYNTFQERQGLRAAANQLADDLRLTKQKALSGGKPSSWCASPLKLSAWRLTFGSSTTTYELKAVCSNGSVSATDKSATLLYSSTVSGSTSVDFKALTGIPTAAATFTVSRTVGGAALTPLTVSVNAAGAVNVN